MGPAVCGKVVESAIATAGRFPDKPGKRDSARCGCLTVAGQPVHELCVRRVDGPGFRAVPFERYSDDIVVHCVSERQARYVQAAIARRLAEVGLELHPDKTRLVYCKDSKRRGTYENTSFTFLGYTFRPRKAFNKKTAETFTGFLPGVSRAKLTQMSRRVRAWRPLRLTTNTLDDLARGTNPVVRGWLAYFTAFYPTAVTPVRMRLDRALMRWARRKYKRLSSDERARRWLAGVRQRVPGLFAHWSVTALS